MQETPFDSWVRKIAWRRDRLPTPVFLGFPWGSAGKESSCKVGDLGSISGLGRSSGEGKGYPLQYSGLENSMGSQRVEHDWATFIVRREEMATPCPPPPSPPLPNIRNTVSPGKLLPWLSQKGLLDLCGWHSFLLALHTQPFACFGRSCLWLWRLISMPIPEWRQQGLLLDSFSFSHTETILARSQLVQGCNKKCLVQSRQHSA